MEEIPVTHLSETVIPHGRRNNRIYGPVNCCCPFNIAELLVMRLMKAFETFKIIPAPWFQCDGPTNGHFTNIHVHAKGRQTSRPNCIYFHVELIASTIFISNIRITCKQSFNLLSATPLTSFCHCTSISTIASAQQALPVYLLRSKLLYLRTLVSFDANKSLESEAEQACGYWTVAHAVRRTRWLAASCVEPFQTPLYTDLWTFHWSKLHQLPRNNTCEYIKYSAYLYTLTSGCSECLSLFDVFRFARLSLANRHHHHHGA